MASSPSFDPLHGQCTCGALTYTMNAKPLIVHCCHCTWCQRETGTAFLLNAMVESTNFTYKYTPTPSSTTTTTITATTTAAVLFTPTPTASGSTQTMARCPACLTVVFSHYSGFGSAMTFVKAGTLSEGSRQRVRPDLHIFTSTKAEWLDLSAEAERGVPIFDEYYDKEVVWSEEALERRSVLVERIRRERTENAGREAESQG
ncbi:hypothetical protein K505DRAFT_323589 [Melanomma pulvis-pyrius CBS 109.77]|uniref:CENP-V/GFA domain-containing protein n=1 Tax=Melanomma pulvis-pyrius CBS 109.77 TaxID=1314802 RepID=A0A6A6XHZ2_9PLEO|nr:hypothetical protein K505DRAFT_323589 [Melanomma pulvis-pyrius CBS 109.77]